MGVRRKKSAAGGARKRSATAKARTPGPRLSEEHLQRAVTEAPLVLWAVDADGVFTVSVGRGLQQLGLAPGEAVGQSLFEMYAGVPAILTAVHRCLQTGEDIRFLAEVPAGVFDTRITAQRSKSGRIVGAIGVSIDVTERTRMERALRGLSRRLWSIQEEERRRIARELHDEAGQAMTALKLRLDLARREEEPHAVREQLEAAAGLAGDVLRELRRISHELRPGALEELGLVPAIRALVADFRARTGVQVDLVEPEHTPHADRDCESAVFRFVQEALSNVSRHSRAKNVSVRLECDAQHVRMSVEDDGLGFDPELPPSRDSLGLAVVKERARILGGELLVESKRGAGSRLVLDVPVSPPPVAA
ncbi:MAG TPA: histidine kinase [bacterium]|nr:histidine kinase [bacterium]